MTEVTLQITVAELKKMLAESILSDELKTAYAGVLDQMTDDEKAQLVSIITEGAKAKTDYEKQRLEQLARLNAALEKHLKDVLRSEQKYIRTQFEQLGAQDDKEELNNLENLLTNL